jgi:hypothetical protein
MTVLSACQEAAIELNQPQPASLFSTTKPFDIEIRTQAGKAATAIAKAYDWQAITALQTMTGDGTSTSFALPADYDHMPQKARVMTSQFATSLAKARDLDHWLALQLYETVAVPGYWIILNGAMQILPALASGVAAKFYYIRNTIITGAASAAQATFVADADTFNLPERLLTLGAIWRWRAQKRMEYAEDLQNFEIALAEEVARDKGSRVITVGRQRLPANVDLAHPAIVVP